MASRKPRKRLSATKAEVEGPPLHRWEYVFGSYVFNPAPNVSAKLTEDGEGKCQMLVVINGKRYVGERPTLEEAFKATDRLLFQQAKEHWLRSLCSAVLAPWVGSLK